MGYAQRNRLLDLRDAPLNGRDHGPPVPVQFNPIASAFAIVDSILPGKPMPMFVGGPQPMVGQMIDWTAYSDKMRAAMVDQFGPTLDTWPAPAIHEMNAANLVAQFQRGAMALAEAAAGLRAASAVEPDALPEPPADRAPEGVDDGFGHDANGSEVGP